MHTCRDTLFYWDCRHVSMTRVRQCSRISANIYSHILYYCYNLYSMAALKVKNSTTTNLSRKCKHIPQNTQTSWKAKKFSKYNIFNCCQNIWHININTNSNTATKCRYFPTFKVVSSIGKLYRILQIAKNCTKRKILHEMHKVLKKYLSIF